jgi:hypothetical protein
MRAEFYLCVAVEELETMAGKTGFLTKEGKTVQSWKRRWFELGDTELFYYKEQKDAAKKKAQGSILLKEVATVTPSNYKNKQFCLAVSTPKRVYYLVADSNSDMQVRLLSPESFMPTTLTPFTQKKYVYPRHGEMHSRQY